jgi:hypothetical protein
VQDRVAENRDGKARGLLRRPSLVIGFTLGVLLSGLGASASAAVTGLEQVVAQSPTNSSNKSVTAFCPSGKRVLGAGGDISNGLGQVVLGLVRPDAALTSVTVQGREDENGTADNWSVRAIAVCAPPPPALERVSAASASNSANKAVTATCPSGKRLLGAGVEIDGGGGQAAPNDVIPGSALKGVTVQGLEDENGTAVNWRARAYAICAHPVAGLERVVASSPTDSSSTKGATAACPAGKQVVGAGGELGGGGGEVVLDDLTPQPGLDALAVQVFEDEDGTTANWFARAFAICAAKSQRVVQAGGLMAPSVAVGCPAGTQLTGPGADLTDANGQVLITGIVPLGAGATQVAAVPHLTAVNPGSTWFPRAYAICAAPLPGLDVIQMTSATDSISSKAASAACPAGKRVVGAGGSVDGAEPEEAMNLAAVVADAALASVTASGFEDFNGTSDNWSVTAYAVCANRPPGLELVSATTDDDSDAKAITADCPSGKNLLGAGASVAEGGGRVRLDDLRPNADLTRTTATAFEDEFNFTAPWTLTAQAICANP